MKNGKGKPTKLTFDRANDRHPKWSGDGKACVLYLRCTTTITNNGVTKTDTDPDRSLTQVRSMPPDAIEMQYLEPVHRVIGVGRRVEASHVWKYECHVAPAKPVRK